MATYQELKAQAEKLMKEAEALRQKERDGVIAEVKATIRDYGITASELGLSSGSRARGGAAKKPVPVKYRGPNGETWTGRGRQPTWLAQLVAAGKSKEAYAV